MGGMTSRVALLCLLVLSITGCAPRGGTPAQTMPAGAAQARAGAAEPESIRWVRDSAEYEAALFQVYRHVTAHVEAEASRLAPGTWAVILDADETVISNVGYQIERARLGLGFTPDSWYAWVKRREATPLPAAADFLFRVRALGGRIAIVTNRRDAECEDTVAVFVQHALVYDAMLCRPDAGPSDKNPRFEAVADGRTAASSTPVAVIAFVGDNIQDFPRLTQSVRGTGAAGFEAFGARFFLVPNPMYGSWQ